jgi:hypothetical protein
MNIKELTIEEINLILVALGKLPLESTLALFTKIKTQAETQLAELKEKQERTTDSVEVKN